MARKQRIRRGSRKGGRNSTKCSNYLLMNKRITNKKIGLNKHLTIHPNDLDAKKTLKTL